MREERVVLKDEADLPFVDHHFRDVRAVYEDAPRGGGLKAGHHAQGRRFTAAGGAEEGYEFAARHFEVNSFDGVEFYAVFDEGFCYIFKMQIYSHYRFPPCPL